MDYLSFVPDGEPTFDQDLGESIEALRPLGIPIAVLTNATLLRREDVRARLAKADLVSVKVDSVIDGVWHRVNRPHPQLDLTGILEGIRNFAAEYEGTLISETMLLAGINDSRQSIVATANFLTDITPEIAYLAVPTRPPTVRDVHGSDAYALTRAFEIYWARLPKVELLTGHETEPFAHTGDARSDLLAITGVHPMREPAVRTLLERDHADWQLVETLRAAGELKAVDYEGERFYLRAVRRPATD